MKPTIIILTDSRGRGLPEFISEHPESSDYNNIVKVLPGKNLNQIAIEAIQTISNLSAQNYYCVILAGICGLTEVTQIARNKRLHYPLDARSEKVSDITCTVRDLKRRYIDKINICTIIPASLVKYFRYHNQNRPLPPGLEDEQAAHLEDINSINTVICQVNSPETTNINLSRRVLIQSKKKRQRIATEIYRRSLRFSDDQLPDGLHFSDTLKTTCFSLIYTTAIRDLQRRAPSPDPAPIEDPDSSQDSSQSDSEWDFKRKPANSRQVLCVR